MGKLLARALAASIGLGMPAGLVAQPAAKAPDVLIREATSEVVAVLKADRAAGRTSRFHDLVEAKLLPLFDFPRMTASAMAANWPRATPGQKAALTAQFRLLLLRTYSSALAGYRDWPVEFSALAAGAGPGVTVRSSFRQPGVERLTLDYDLQATPEGWKVYDVRLAGISMVLTNRETFAAVVKSSGIDGLIQVLAEKNGRQVKM